MEKEKDKTLGYYNDHAEAYVEGTVAVDFKQTQDRFLDRLNKGAYILDFGCGSGRDTKYFLSQGYQVDAVDGSEELCKLAEKLTGIHVTRMLFSELDADCLYDGIWACSSILHLPKEELADVFLKMVKAVKNQGYIYTSFKYGTFEGYREERYFTDFTEETFCDFSKKIPGIRITEQWISEDVRPGRSKEKWLNVILQKSDIEVEWNSARE